MTMRRDPLAESFRAALEADAAAAPSAEDDALLARAVDRAMVACAAPAPSSSPLAAAPRASSRPPLAPASPVSVRSLSSARQTRLRGLRYALPAAAALVASVALAAVYVGSRPKPAPLLDVGRSSPDVTPPVSNRPAGPPAHVSASASEGAPTVSIEDLPSVSPQPSSSAVRDEGTRGAAASKATAAELFRDANASRRAGDVDKSVELYTVLVARHADSPEAHAGRVSLGRLLLDRRGDAAGALVQFDAYLKSSSADRALAEEARLGRALVFQRQGRHVEERRAWHELLDNHPDTLHASRARERLRVLGEVSPAEVSPAPSSPSP